MDDAREPGRKEMRHGRLYNDPVGADRSVAGSGYEKYPVSLRK
jgi:hypothetical protein